MAINEQFQKYPAIVAEGRVLKALKFLRRYLGPQRKQVVSMAVLLVAAIILELLNPLVIRYYLDTAQSKESIKTLYLAGLVFIGFSILQQIMSLQANYSSQKVGWQATNRLRTDLTLHCLRLDMSFFKKFTPGELIERIDGDVTLLANFFSQFVIRMLGNGLLVLGILLLLYRVDFKVGIGITIYTLVTLIVLSLVQKFAMPRWDAARQASAEQFGYLEERISGVEDIRSVGAEAYVMNGLFLLMRSFTRKTRSAHIAGTLAFNMTSLVYVIGYAFGLAIGVYLYQMEQASIGTAYIIVYYVGMLSGPLQAIREQMDDYQKASASIRRVDELFFMQPQVEKQDIRYTQFGHSDEGHAIQKLPQGPLAVSFSNVTFRYEENETVLKDISFHLKPGKILGILGKTGSGKSTLSRLLFRLYDPTHGQICLDGFDLRELSLSDIRQHVGMVTQEVQLFHASVRDNLTFFDSTVPDTKLEGVLRSLHLWDWVRSLPQGMDTILGSSNLDISAGEAQLLAFGRIFLNDPGLVILDEASSRLDKATETKLEQAVNHLFKLRTGVIIAHRLNTLKRADEILILENGRIIEFGSRKLLADDPNSRYFHLLQTGMEEVLK